MMRAGIFLKRERAFMAISMVGKAPYLCIKKGILLPVLYLHKITKSKFLVCNKNMALCLYIVSFFYPSFQAMVGHHLDDQASSHETYLSRYENLTECIVTSWMRYLEVPVSLKKHMHTTPVFYIEGRVFIAMLKSTD